MKVLIVALVLLAFAAVLAALWRRQVAARRRDYIRHFELPRGLFAQLQKHRPELTLKDCQLVAQGLRQFFLAYLAGGRRHVSMPSQVADELWHEFILFTRNYAAFCRQAFGGFLHHTPAVALSDNRQANAGLRRVWWHVCREENIHPMRPTRLPLIFALDVKLGIAGGFCYAVDCKALQPAAAGAAAAGVVTLCAGDLTSSTADGSTEGLGDGAGGQGSSGGGDGGDGDGGGGGCGGGGCGS